MVVGLCAVGLMCESSPQSTGVLVREYFLDREGEPHIIG